MRDDANRLYALIGFLLTLDDRFLAEIGVRSKITVGVDTNSQHIIYLINTLISKIYDFGLFLDLFFFFINPVYGVNKVR